jgi:glycosyltransferase involved in cell wall biosynthesis
MSLCINDTAQRLNYRNFAFEMTRIMRNPSIRLFITVYKNIAFLKKVLDSVALQEYKNFKVSVLEDGSSTEMAEFIQSCKYGFVINHYTQEDIGFRKNRIMNVGIKNAHEDLLVFIDADCVLHPTFLATYAKHYEQNTVLFAKRVELDSKTTERLISSNRVIPSRLEMILNGSSRVEDSFRLPFKPIFISENPRLLGCNMAIPRPIMLNINGFDEDYEITGYGEDSDIEWRILKAGFKFKNLKFHVVQYHLFHERIDREEHTSISRALYNFKKEAGAFFCKNGLVKV